MAELKFFDWDDTPTPIYEAVDEGMDPQDIADLLAELLGAEGLTPSPRWRFESGLRPNDVVLLVGPSTPPRGWARTIRDRVHWRRWTAGDILPWGDYGFVLVRESGSGNTTEENSDA